MHEANKRQAIRNIILFTILVNGLAWLGPVLGGSPAEPGLGFLIWGTAPFVAALVMKLVVRDKVDMGWRPRLKGNGRYYVLSIFLFPVTITLVLALGVWLGITTLSNFALPPFVSTLAPLAITYFIFAFFEEVGWRGYLAPKVYGLNDSLLGHALVGLIWASWHFPYMQDLWAHTSESMITLLPRFVLGTMVFAVVYGEIRLRTGSLWPAVLMHWTGNTIANSLLVGFVVFAPEWAWLGSFGVEGVLMILFIGLVGAVLYRNRRRQSSSQPAVVAGQTV